MERRYTKANPLRVFSAFSGYDSQCMALDRLGIDYELVGWSEIDKYAIQAHNAVYPQYGERNFGDISKIEWGNVPDFDLFTYSFPCQDISSAGKQGGLEEGSGTRSSLLWECGKAIEAKRPKYLLMENVKALTQKKFLPYLHKWMACLEGMGYSNYAKVLNAKDYGVPQNRERVFMVSILDENASYHFPEPFPLYKRLEDILEEDVDEKYYLSQKLVDYVFSNGGKEGNIQGGIGVHDKNDEVANTITAQYWKSPRQGNYLKEPIACAMRGREVQCLTPKRTEYGKKVRKEYESGYLKESRHNMQQLEPRTDGVCNTITSVQKDCLIIEPFNVCDDGTARTIKAQYYKNGMANFKRTDGLGATGVKVIANMYENNVQGGRIYDDKGISPTIGANSGGNLQPKIIQKARGFNKGGEHEISPTISSNSWECNNILIEPKIPSHPHDANGKVVDRHLKDVANTIHGGTGGGENTDSYVVEPSIVIGSAQKHAYVGSVKGISPCINAACGMGGGQTPMVADEQMFRIRKLTERECFRLMDVDDADIDKIQAAGISKSQQYKMAGNSIVTNVLFHIFRKLFVDKGPEEMTLF